MVSSSNADYVPEAPTMVSWTTARSRLARAIQTGEPPQTVTELRREYKAARLAYLIRTVAPELTDVQRAELSGVLADGGDTIAAS